MNTYRLLSLLAITLLMAVSCKKQEYLAPAISGVGTDTMVLNVGDKVVLAPTVTNLHDNGYVWLVNGKVAATNQLNYTFEATEPGNFAVVFKAGNEGGTTADTFHLFVEKPIALSLQEGLAVSMCNVIEIKPTVSGPARADYTYQWLIGDSLIGKQLNLSFISPRAGTYDLTLKATAGTQAVTATRTITVKAENYGKNANTVLAFVPAPGKQHNWAILGDKSLWDLGMEYPLPYNEFLAKASEIRKTNLSASLFVGSWGGYATFKFDHTVANVAGKTDIELTAFYSSKDLPGVYVAYDRNKNGQPDEDEWYEIKTENYGLEDTVADYAMDFKFDSATTDDKRVNVYYSWKDNLTVPVGGQIVSSKTYTSAMTYANTFSVRGFWPGLNMIDLNARQVSMLAGWKNSFTLRGKRITKNVTGGAPFFQKMNIDIDNAVNSKGENVQLPGIDFVKVRKVVYPLAQLAGVTGLVDQNLEEGRTLQVGSIIDKHLP